MSGILNSGMSGSTANLPDTTGRAFSSPFSGQSGSSIGDLNYSDGIGLRNINGSFNLPNIPGTYNTARNSALAGGPTSVAQPAAGSMSNGRFTVNNLPIALSQQSPASSHGHSGSGIPQNLGSSGRIISSLGNLGNGGNIGRNLSSGGLNMAAIASRLNLTAPQIASLLGNSYSATGGTHSQNQFQAGNNQLSSLALLNELNSREHASFDVNDFPQLSGHLNSAGPQGQLGLGRRQNVGFMQQNQEFSIQNEDFPALPGYKGGNNEYPASMHQKDQLRESVASMMQSQHLPVGRSGGFNLGGGYSSHQQQHSQLGGSSYLPSSNQDLHFNNSEARNNGIHSSGSRPLNMSNAASGGVSYDQLIQQYQQFQKQSQLRMASPFRDQDLKSAQSPHAVADRFGLLGLLSVIRMSNPDLTSLALGIDLMTLGLNLNSPENLHKNFASPWSEEPFKGEPHHNIPECFIVNPPPQLNQECFARLRVETLFYIFYSMPKDEAQLYAANELHSRGWFFHKEIRLWMKRVPNLEHIVQTPTYERGCYYCFDPNSWKTIQKDNFVVQYDSVEDRPAIPRR